MDLRMDPQMDPRTDPQMDLQMDTVGKMLPIVPLLYRYYMRWNLNSLGHYLTVVGCFSLI